MLTIKDINNNTRGVKYCDHKKDNFTKADILAYAQHIADTKHAFINLHGAHKGARVTYAIEGGRAAINHAAPKKMICPLRIWQREPFDCPLDCNDYYNDIITTGNRDYIERDCSEYHYLFKAIKHNIIDYDELFYELEDIKRRRGNYNSMRDCIADILGVTPVNKYQASKVYAITKKCYTQRVNANDTIAELLTILTPHKWSAGTIRGCCQRDWQNIIYPTDIYNDDDIDSFEAFYFGLFWEYQAGRRGDFSTWYTYTMNTSEDKIINDICSDFDTQPDNVIFYEYK